MLLERSSVKLPRSTRVRKLPRRCSLHLRAHHYFRNSRLSALNGLSGIREAVTISCPPGALVAEAAWGTQKSKVRHAHAARTAALADGGRAAACAARVSGGFHFACRWKQGIPERRENILLE